MTTEAQPITSLLAAEAAIQASWSTSIPAWHPRAESAGGAPAGVAAGGGEGEGGQGEGSVAAPEPGSGDDLFRPYLANMPQELHPLITQALQAQNQDFTRRFQDGAQFRSQMEPYTKIEGFTDIPPEEMQGLVDLRRTFDDPQALNTWINNAIGVMGDAFTPDEQLSQRLAQAPTPPAPGADPAAEGLLAQVTALLDEKLGPINKFMGQTEQTQAASAAEAEMRDRYAALAAEHGIDPDDVEIEQAIADLGHAYINDDDTVGKAFERYLQMTGGSKAGDAIEQRLGGTNGATLTGGQPGTPPATASWHGNGPTPKEQALARMRQ